MPLNPDDLQPIFNDWFKPNIEYIGHGRAEFLSPKESIEGPVVVSFNERGEAVAEMRTPRLSHCEQDTEDGLVDFIDFFSFRDNPCVCLSLNASEGTFTATVPVSDDITDTEEVCGLINSSRVSTDPELTRINFSLKDSQFDTHDSSKPKYWVIPLLNFVSDFHQCITASNPKTRSVDTHPLRIYKPAILPMDIEEKDYRRALIFANRKTQLILFEFLDEVGFIEALPDYKDREAKLINGEADKLITSVMVGEVGDNSIEPDDIFSWFPFYFVPLLSLATGTEVGIPWIEFRDESGALVRRLDPSFGLPKFAKGHKAIDESVDFGIGHLLTEAQTSEDLKDRNKRDTILAAIRYLECV